ncbi:MAG: protein YbfQ [Candidatus Parcubacteria bacterium]|jgi:UPF0176 protein
MKEFEILLYYKYIPVADPQALLASQRKLCEDFGLKGRIILAEEGINGTVEGTKENTQKYIDEMSKDSRFGDMHWKRSVGTGSAFPRLSIKVRTEIVSGHLEDEDVKPWETTGKRLSPDELYAWLNKGEEFTIVDMRNDYEYRVGRFEGSIDPGMENFRDIQKILPKIEPLKEKKVLTVCTGGVRCEKASGYLVKKGFKDVYQLDGGIVSFMEKYPNTFFKGKLYVFDNRIAMDFDDPEKHVIVGSCMKCNTPNESYVNCMNLKCHKHFICCENCREEDGEVYCSNDCKEKNKKVAHV